MKHILFLSTCLFILVMGINEAAAQALVLVTPRVQQGAVNSVFTLTVLVIDANGRPVSGHSVAFTRRASDSSIRLGTTATGTFTSDSLDVNTDTSGQATAYVKITEQDSNAQIFVSVINPNLTASFVVRTTGSNPSNSAPVFSDGASTTRSIAENSAANTNIGSAVTATDADSGNPINYILTGTDASSFRINTGTGQLQTVAALDYETKNSYSVTVKVYDSRGGSDSIDVTINVTDVSEGSSPVFTEGETATRRVDENRPVGTNIGDPVAATDADAGDTLTYSVYDPDPTDPTDPDDATISTLFSIDSNGQLTTLTKLDYETTNSYTAFVVVSDGTGNSDTITVTIRVRNVQDTLADNAIIPLSATERTGSLNDVFALTVLVLDANGKPASGKDVSFQTAGGTGLGTSQSGPFTFGTGVTTNASGQATAYAKLVSAETDGQHAISASTIISNASIRIWFNVYTTGTAPSNSAPVFSDGTSTTRLMADNTAANTNIGSAITATDADSDSLLYSLTGTDASSFSIHTITGQLKTAAALNYNNQNSYSVTVKVYDQKGGSDSITVTIDRGGSPPVFTEGETATRSVQESQPIGTTIGDPIAATDADNDTLTYSVYDPDPTDPTDPDDATLSTLFSIDSTGQLTTLTKLDYETTRSHTAFVVVSDGTGNSDTITVTISVRNIQDTLANNAIIPLSATEQTGSLNDVVALTVLVLDGNGKPDSGETVTFFTSGGTRLGTSQSGPFILTNNANTNSSGQATIYAKLTAAESDGIHAIRARITVSGEYVSIFFRVYTTGTPPSNSAPVFSDGTSTTRRMANNTAANTDIGSPVTATDADSDTLLYSLTGTDASSFRIHTITGQLQTAAALNYNNQNSYSVTVKAYDQKGGSDSITVTINGAGSPPVFTEGETATRRVEENRPVGTNIGDPLAATDADSTTLTYSVYDPNPSDMTVPDTSTSSTLFSIDSTGQLTTLTKLDYETKNSYTAFVVVSDDTGNSDTITVTINVRNVQDTLASKAIIAISPTERSGSLNDVFPITVLIVDANGRPDSGEEVLFFTSGGTRLDTAENGAFSLSGTTVNTDASGQVTMYAKLVSAETDGQHAISASTIISGHIVSIDFNVRTTGTVVSNSSPLFSEGTSTTRVMADNTAANTDIGSPVTATDADSDTLLYSLTGTDASSFRINFVTGQLKTAAALDYDDQNSYSVTVKAYDNKGGSDSITVTIDDAGSPPEFTEGDTATRSVQENQPAGTNVGSPFAATDPDNDTLTYRVDDPSPSDPTNPARATLSKIFSIDSNGQLKTKKSLDYETKSSYTAFVVVSDHDDGSDTITVTINVTDIPNESGNAPVFAEGTSASRSISRSAANASGNVGAPVSATDPDGQTLTYSLGGTNAVSFGINSSTGQLRVSYIPPSTQGPLNVTVTATDTTNLTASIAVTIYIRESPVFTDGTSTTRSVPENTASSTNIGGPITATVADGETITYSLEGTDAASFGIVSNSGQLQTKVALDYETKNSYSVTVKASDAKGGSDSITVTINVTDVNENTAPTFTEGSSATRSIAENTAPGTNIGSPISATDPDTGDTLTYSLSGTDAGSFAIVSSSGQLQTKADLDYETKNSYSVTVTASDGNGGSDTIAVTISITNVNEDPPPVDPPVTNNPPTFTEGSSATRSIAENTPANRNIGSPISATDPDAGDTLTYSLSGTDAGSFRIVSTSGQLRTSAVLDYETKSTYAVTVGVSDGNGGSDTIAVTINVTDVPEQPSSDNTPPVFSDGTSTTRSIAENTATGTAIGTAVSATDTDAGDTLTYSLEGTDAAAFGIVSASGQLQTAAALNYEEKNAYTVTVRVSDGNGGADTIDVTINVTDVNEAPVFAPDTPTFLNVAENTASGTNIGNPFSATDPEGDTLRYSLMGSDTTEFRIHSGSGQLRTAGAFTYQTKSIYSVTVTATDRQNLSAATTLTINITPVTASGNNSPVFGEGNRATRSVAENTESGVAFGPPVSATDPDGDQLTYRLGGTDASAFGIASANGQLRTSAALDYETKSTYTVTVTATDGNGGSATIPVSITVTDVDESPPPTTTNQAPVFSEGLSTSRSVAENTESGVPFGNPVSATDADGDTLTYRLGGTDGAAFGIASRTGQLRTSAALDYETKPTYTVTVTATDSNGESANITVTVNITDVDEPDAPVGSTPPAPPTGNNRAPVFSEGASTSRSVAENTALGSNIGTPVSATDADGDPLTYRLGGTDGAAFGIDSRTGQLRTAAPLNYETKNSYAVTVTVFDSNGGSARIAVSIAVTKVADRPITTNQPNLAVSVIPSTSATVAPNAAFTLTAVVRNSGAAASTPTTLRYYRSVDARITVNDILVGSSGVVALAAEVSTISTQTLRITLRAPAVPGTYYYGACVDAVAGEADTINNCSTAVILTVTSPPDLTVDTPSVSKSLLAPGESFTLTATVRNQGGGRSTAATLRYYRSTDATITTSDTEVGTSVALGLLHGANTGMTNTDTQNVVLTAPSEPGTYYYGACVSTSGNETLTTNNCSGSVKVTIISPPDLVVDLSRPRQSTFAPGESFTLTATLSNQGDSASGAVILRYYENRDRRFIRESQIDRVFVRGLSADSSRDEHLTLTAPSEPGVYYYHACVDAVTNEERETDNNCSRAVAITVVQPLIIEAFQPNLSAIMVGESFTLAATVKNDGDVQSTRATLQYYRSSDDRITSRDTSVGSRTVTTLAAGATTRVSLSLTAPNVAGIYYYGACIGDGGVTEDCPVVKIAVADIRIDAAERPPMYWIDADAGTLISLTDARVNRLIPGVENAKSIAVDRANGKIYWTEQTGRQTGRIQRANLDGTNIEMVRNLTSSPQGLALDTANQKLYLTNAWGKVQRMNLDGTGFKPNLIVNLDAPQDVAVDAAAGKIYWTEQTSPRTGLIRRANLDGTNIEGVRNLTSVAQGLALDTANQKLYITNASDKVQRMNLDGTGFKPNFIANLDAPTGVAVDAAGGKIYWAESNLIQRADLNGENVETVATGLGTPVGLILSPIPVEAHISEAQRPPIYWYAATGGLQRLTAAEVEDIAPGTENITGIAIDIRGGQLYWTEQTSPRTGLIQRADLNGKNVEIVKMLTSAPKGLAIDTVNQKLYLTNAWGKVQRMNFDGTGFKPDLIVNLDSPEAVAVDGAGGKVYWTEQTGPRTGLIQRANLNGTNIEMVRNLTSAPKGLAIDTANQKLYLTNAWGKVQRMNLDGTGFKPNLIVDLNAPQGVAVDAAAGKVYWTEQDGIRRANLDGSNIQDVVTGFRGAAGIALGVAPVNTSVAAAPETVVTGPKTTTLLPNYPNPFNPETWIPYQLQKPASVKISIYNQSGVLVRELSLGYQAAGAYLSRSRAAYWDGRNQAGEPVASGLYFYTLTAGDYAATRKLSIVK